SSAGFWHSAATSRRMWIASDSRSSRCFAWCAMAALEKASTTVFTLVSPLLRGVGKNFFFTHVQAAFLLAAALPPPAAGAYVLARCDGAGARRASDGRVSAVVQRAVRHVVVAQVGPHIVLRPVDQRIEFRYAVARVEFFVAQVLPA